MYYAKFKNNNLRIQVINNNSIILMKRFYLLLFFATQFTLSFCQEKPTIAILPFQFNSSVTQADANAIAQKVESGFINSKRFTVIERTNFEQIFKELDAQKSEVYLNSSKLAKQGELIGASQIVVGNVSSAGNEGVTFNIKVVDVSTGETIGSKTISDYGKRKGMSITKSLLDVATSNKTARINDNTANILGGALLNIDNEIQEFITDTYALTYEIIEISKTKGEEAIEIIIVGGREDGLKSSATLEVIQESIKTLGSKKLRQKSAIGKIKVEKVEGDVTVCKVTSGGKEIKEYFSPSNKVYVSTVTKK